MVVWSSTKMSISNSYTLDKPQHYLTDAVRIENMSYCYDLDNALLPVLDNVSLSINGGDTCAIIGPSGAGKSTLLNLIGLLEKPNTGKIIIAGHDTSSSTADQRAILRNLNIGFIFQSFNLLPRLSALENVALPLMYRGIRKNVALSMAEEELMNVGLSQRLQHRPHELSGGQGQRVAIARALVGKPSILLADEPTGNLDRETGDMIFDLLISLNALRKTTLIMVTHDAELTAKMDRRFKVSHGRIVEIKC